MCCIVMSFASQSFISFSNGLTNGEPFIVCALIMWSSNISWMSSIDVSIDTPFHISHTDHTQQQCENSRDLELWPMTLTTKHDPGSFKMNQQAKCQIQVNIQTLKQTQTHTLDKLLQPAKLRDVIWKNKLYRLTYRVAMLTGWRAMLHREGIRKSLRYKIQWNQTKP